MNRSFGPAIIVDAETNEIKRIHCHWCIFNRPRGKSRVCDHAEAREIEPELTPDWCKMKQDALRDARDIIAGVKFRVIRWSGRKTDEPRELYAGIPSEAARHFRIAARDAKRGTVRLEDGSGKTIEMWPEAKA